MNARLSPISLQKAGICPVLQQSGAVCYRIEQGTLQVLLVTTRRSGRWIIPKGWLIDGRTPAETAAQEAWEEAGVIGTCIPKELGRFSYVKHRAGAERALCLVDVFPLKVQALAQDFPERDERKRTWLSPKKASQRVTSPNLAALLRRFDTCPH